MYTPPVTHFIPPVPGLACPRLSPCTEPCKKKKFTPARPERHKQQSSLSPVRPQQKRRRGNRGTAQFHQPPSTKHRQVPAPQIRRTKYQAPIPDFTYPHTTCHRDCLTPLTICYAPPPSTANLVPVQKQLTTGPVRPIVC
ncbi:hypothetical protein LZ30DRAFT_383415 [Colletotrichum cereale]|nr:hypothetical protein LZ30DRAFT_383415 [Colletotrichum cereale]